jgi:hypothetical protein
MTPETAAILDRMKPTKSVWCQFGQAPGFKIDEHQVCIDQRAAHYARGFSSWGCTCNCHR